MWMDQSMWLLKALDNDSFKASFFSLTLKKKTHKTLEIL